MVNHYIKVDPVLLDELKNVLQMSRAFLNSRPTYPDKIAQMKLIDRANNQVQVEIQRQFTGLINTLSENFRKSYGFLDQLTINPDKEANVLLHDSFDLRKKIDNMAVHY